MDIPLYVVDAFAERCFAGNPAAVCPLGAWLADETMQAIAGENNLSETAFFVPEGEDYALRWFTPAVEVDLCGHATLATAHVISTVLAPGRERMRFLTRSGPLVVMRTGSTYALDLPARPAQPCATPPGLAAALGRKPDAVLKSVPYLAVFADEAAVASLEPDFAGIAALDGDGVIATAPGRAVDFVSRYFAPAAGIPEDPVTGMAHCTLVPYWSRRLGRKTLTARQISKRGGDLHCEDRGERVILAGRAATYLEGRIRV